MFDANQLSFIVLPGNPFSGFKSMNLYDQAYKHFKSVWERTFTRRIGPGGYDAYSFFRQDFVMLLMHNREIVGQLCSSFIDLHSKISEDLAYLQNFRGEAEAILSNRGCRTFATLEYSSISPAFSQRKIGVCLNDFVNVLGANFVFSKGADVAGGLPRRITGTNEKVLLAGYEKVSEQKARLGLTVDVVLGFKGKILFPGPNELALQADRIWNQRTDLTQPSIEINRQLGVGYEFDQSAVL